MGSCQLDDDDVKDLFSRRRAEKWLDTQFPGMEYNVKFLEWGLERGLSPGAKLSYRMTCESGLSVTEIALLTVGVVVALAVGVVVALCIRKNRAGTTSHTTG